jgi:hypothetical protein
MIYHLQACTHHTWCTSLDIPPLLEKPRTIKTSQILNFHILYLIRKIHFTNLGNLNMERVADLIYNSRTLDYL